MLRLMGIGVSEANLTILLPSGSISMTIPADRQFSVLDAHSNAPGSAQTEQDRRWPGAQKIARGER